MLAGKAEECNGDTQLRITQYGQFRCANNTGFVPIALQEGHCCYVYMLLLTNETLLLECSTQWNCCKAGCPLANLRSGLRRSTEPIRRAKNQGTAAVELHCVGNTPQPRLKLGRDVREVGHRPQRHRQIFVQVSYARVPSNRRASSFRLASSFLVMVPE